MTKATAVAPSNLAFIKYWGLDPNFDPDDRVPTNDSLSVCLNGLTTTTTVEIIEAEADEITIDDQSRADRKIINHIDRIRALADSKSRVRVHSTNSFPEGTGLSSSASGIAALTVAACEAFGVKLDEREMTKLARRGSGSAARSIPDGFVRWTRGDDPAESYAESIFPPEHWALDVIVPVTSVAKKQTPTSDAQLLAHTSPLFETRLKQLPAKFDDVVDAIKNKDFDRLGPLIEAEAFELHAIMLTSRPPLVYWTEKTLALPNAAQRWRADGVNAWVSMNTGQNAYFVCEPSTTLTLVERLTEIGADHVIASKLTLGTRLVTDEN